ncbi:MAG: hypothetical protein IPJ61_20510 [Tessaracoccus sp.]|uniref:phage tail tube protein n=1 Tax=Tessaracoccus sp. TaxID=1971211 RepID=UPI001EBBE425|nr:phage tail tube protein [Tessaracoccus sp.]MBK7823371.1 hypothetical protein [Tessaracoccus sp.]
MASVQDVQFMIGDETTFGTPVTVTRSYEPKSGDGMEYRPNRKQGEGLRVGAVGPIRDRRVTPNFDYGGPFNLEPVSKSYGYMINKLCGGTATHTVVSGAVYQTVHTLGGPLKPFTMQHGIPRLSADGSAVVDPFTYTGCTVPTFGFSMDNADILQLRLDVDARDLSLATGLATPNRPTGANLFSFAGASLYGGTYAQATNTALATGATPLANITNWSMDVTRNADVSRFLAGNGGRKSIPVPGLAAVTGTIGIEYSDTVYRDAFLADTDLTLVVNFEAATLATGKETIQFAIANFRLDGELPKPTGEINKASCNYTALENGTNPLLQIMQRTLDTAI